MTNQTMRYCQIPLQSYLTVNQRNKLTLRLHAIKNVVLVRYYSKAVRIFYKDSINKLAIIQVLGYKVNIPVVNKPKETLPVKKDINNELQAYKRDAIISLVGFVGLQVLKKFAPQVYTSLNIVRSLFVLGIARNVIKNGLKGLLTTGIFTL